MFLVNPRTSGVSLLSPSRRVSSTCSRVNVASFFSFPFFFLLPPCSTPPPLSIIVVTVVCYHPYRRRVRFCSLGSVFPRRWAKMTRKRFQAFVNLFPVKPTSLLVSLGRENSLVPTRHRVFSPLFSPLTLARAFPICLREIVESTTKSVRVPANLLEKDRVFDDFIVETIASHRIQRRAVRTSGERFYAKK